MYISPKPYCVKLDIAFREAFKNYLADFASGYPPIPLSFFEHNDFPLRGGEYPPIP